MESQQNRLPSEFLQLVSTRISLEDCSNCLLVCKFWHNTFQRALYRRIRVNSEGQLEQLIKSLQLSYFYENKYNNGLLIKEIHLANAASSGITTPAGSVDSHTEDVSLSQRNITLLGTLCPDLEVLTFDESQWKHIKLESLQVTWKHMRECPPLNLSGFNASFLNVFGSNLVKLQIMHRTTEIEMLVGKIELIPTLEDLTLVTICDENQNDQDQNNQDQSLLPLSQYLQKIHLSLNKLRRLTLIRNKVPAQETSDSFSDSEVLSTFTRPSNLQFLALDGHVDSVKWFAFISSSYPELQEIKLTQISTSRFGTKWIWQHALVQLIHTLSRLKSLTIGGKNIPQLFSKALCLELKKPSCSIDNLYVDFQTYQAIESCQFLLVVADHGLRQLRHLRLRVWEQIPGWSGVTSNLFQCQQLVSLELSLSKGHRDQFPFTSFLVDNFLYHMPQLECLSLTGAKVQVTYNHFVHLKKDNTNFALQKLELTQSKVENHKVVFEYLSFCCPNFHELVLQKCETSKVLNPERPLLTSCDIYMPHTTLERIVISSSMIYTENSLSNDFAGIRVVPSNNDGRWEETKSKNVWCKFAKKNDGYGSFVYPCYVLGKEDVEKENELNDLYQAYKDSTDTYYCMPGNYASTIGVITVYCKLATNVWLDHLKIPTAGA